MYKHFKVWSWLFAPLALCGGAALSNSEAESEKSDSTAGQCLKLAREVYAEMIQRAKEGQGHDIEDLELWSRNLLGAELEAASNRDERTAAHAAHVERTKGLEEIAKGFERSGQGRQSEALAAEFYRLQAERGQAEAQQK